MGEDGKDKRYRRNWTKAKEKGYLRGAYHYYRPHENSTLQFNNFAQSVKLEKGDFPPVLDIEIESRHGTENLRRGVLNWLKLAEEKYKVKPILYTGRSFYYSYLKGHVEDYPLWIASYSGKHKLRGINWTMHQFTEEVKVKGIPEMVDGNDFNGTLEELKEFGIK
jgi:GH25 family lysozyme M1 (1,4-beta-N-acetylmuramidase)